jgi:FkbM family methyltransferase
VRFSRQGVDATTGALADLLTDPLVVVDVGCRWGFADQWHRLGSKCHTIGFDPDVEECERLETHYAGQGHVRVVPLGLGAEVGPATLYLTKNPVGHSLLPTVTDVVERHPALDGGKIVGTTTVDITTLDTFCADDDVAYVDVIKIDTQGWELAVLQGAEKILSTVKAVEVEVEFNELYENVPLFGEIDRYLRDRGFVLWRFKDMAHYAQEGVPLDWWGEEYFYYDSLLARFLTGGGQLFWANAYYLKREVAYPDTASGWESLVRHACIASALGFHDLVGLTLARARDLAPEAARAAMDATLAEDALQVTGKADFSESTTVLADELMLEVDDPRFSGWGWRPVQRLDFGCVRWTGPAREAAIDLPHRLLPGTGIDLLVVAAMSTAILDGLVLEVNRVPVALERATDAHGIVFKGVVPDDYSSDRHYTRLVLRTPDTIPWNTLHPESWDDTELGMALSWLRLTPR